MENVGDVGGGGRRWEEVGRREIHAGKVFIDITFTPALGVTATVPILSYCHVAIVPSSP